MSGLIASIADARMILLPRHAGDGGALVVAEGQGEVPFAIARVFTIKAQQGSVRGRHAHRKCAQFMICVSGAVDVALDDGAAQKTISLMRDNEALLVPPMLWVAVAFRARQSVLAVLCDRPYEADDYIGDYDAYRALRSAPVS